MPKTTKNKRSGRRKKSAQPEKRYNTWGGKRPGAGRKPSPSSGESHLRKPRVAARWPVHISLKLTRDLPGLRTRKLARIVQLCILAANTAGIFRIVHFALEAHGLHLIVEAKNREALSRGMQGLGIRLARRLNKETGHRGRVIEDRFHEHILRTPQEVRDALCRVLRNHARHAAARDPDGLVAGVDPYSSGVYFDGWRDYKPSAGPEPPPVAAPKTYLLQTGWRRCGLISISEVPG